MNPKIPAEVRHMILKMPHSSKVILNNYYDENSQFLKHAGEYQILSEITFKDASDISLYHYTSMDNLIAILTSQNWLIKEKSYMNDINEFSYTYDLGRALLSEYNASSDALKSFDDMEHQNPLGDAYIWSFSRNRESQTLSSVYSKYDGVAIKFDLNDIQSTLATHFSHGKSDPNELTNGDAYVFPLRCIYIQEKQKELLAPLLKEWLGAFESLQYDPSDMREILAYCNAGIGAYAMSFKNPLLYQEEEIRFVVVNHNEDFQLHPEVVIKDTPFVQFKVPDGLIKEVIINTNSNVSPMKLDKKIKRLGYNGVKVLKSELPY